ncbi:hypothetical protein OKA05_06975 [Luteolibacter arcticus]|uniref:Lipoprotein n=1 Tax=Luteolibacter arcticus TaxID=1581411 RepID=A0ABT3GFB2_9BACT|nr:hypothetical protein [Luteolibacter arcticus]MCW1922290.1 hypothetical protein [Luteolibacter arcticus]
MRRLLLALAAIIAPCTTSCVPRTYEALTVVEHSGPAELDPIGASFEAHIFTLSPLKAAVPTSEEYRQRISEGKRHPKTLARKGEEYLYIPSKSSSQYNSAPHDYLLDRSCGRFMTTSYDPEFTSRLEYARDGEGWRLQLPLPNHFNNNSTGPRSNK